MLGRPFLRSTLHRSTIELVSRRFVTSEASHTRPGSPRLSKYARRTAYLAVGIGAVYAGDKAFNASAISRNFRTLWTVSLYPRDEWNKFVNPSHSAQR